MSHISVCVCSYKRPQLLGRTLASIREQRTGSRFTYSVVVADNDDCQSGRAVVEEAQGSSSVPIIYCVEPRRSISFARNLALKHAEGNLIAFIDDDECAEEDWLLRHFEALDASGAAGVLGPVRPTFDSKPPEWLIKGRFCERPEHPTGHVMPWRECRTGNVLFRKSILSGIDDPFLAEFGASGGDVNFFCRMMQNGHVFVWCNEAIVHEVVPPARWKRTFLLRRGLLRGAQFLKQPEGRAMGIMKSIIATPAYVLLLPFALLAGHHHLMRYLIKLCDHSSRLLSIFGLRLVVRRDM
jgi:succinoglycan biosynthesis protein ExoM